MCQSSQLLKLPAESKELYNNNLDFIIRRGADVNGKNRKGETPLHFLCAQGSPEVIQRIFHAIERLKSQGVLHSPRISSREASAKKKEPYFEVNINTRNVQNETPIFYACKAGPRGKSVISLLCKNPHTELTVVSDLGNLIECSGANTEAKSIIVGTLQLEQRTLLSAELWEKIFKFLTPECLVHIGEVSREFCRLASSDDLWLDICTKRQISTRHVQGGWKRCWMTNYNDMKFYGRFREKMMNEKTGQVVKCQSIVRAWLLRKKYSNLRVLQRNRFKLVKELVETERSYVEGLRIVVKLYLIPLRGRFIWPAGSSSSNCSQTSKLY